MIPLKIAAIGIILMLVSTSYVLPTVEEIDYIIQEMETALFIHEWYVEHDYHREITGTVRHHLKWIDTYNRTIIVLRTYRNWIKILRGGIYLK